MYKDMYLLFLSTYNVNDHEFDSLLFNTWYRKPGRLFMKHKININISYNYLTLAFAREFVHVVLKFIFLYSSRTVIKIDQAGFEFI